VYGGLGFVVMKLASNFLRPTAEQMKINYWIRARLSTRHIFDTLKQDSHRRVALALDDFNEPAELGSLKTSTSEPGSAVPWCVGASRPNRGQRIRADR